MITDQLFDRYRELQSYVGWTDEDARRVAAIGTVARPLLAPLIDDFYAQIELHPAARKVITGGQAQIERLKGTLLQWIRELLAGRYDASYVERRWRVGWRTSRSASIRSLPMSRLSRLRGGLCRILAEHWTDDHASLQQTTRSLNTLLDLDLAIIEVAYQSEFALRLQRSERWRLLAKWPGSPMNFGIRSTS